VHDGTKGVDMERIKITDELTQQWIRLWRRGESYRSIGRKFDVDPRTVKSWIQRAGEEQEKEHWEAVSRQVDAKYLDEHYRMLLQVAAAVLDAVHTDPVFVHHELEAHLVLHGRVQAAMQKSPQLLEGRGLEIEPGMITEFASHHSEIDNHPFERLGSKLLDALMEHEPRLKTAIEAWESDWTKFQMARLKLVEVAKNLFKHANAGDTITEALKTQAVQEVLGNKLFNQEPCSSRVEVFDGKIAHLIRCSGRAEMRVYTGSKQEVEAASKTYEKVLSQISHKERVNPLEDSYHSLMNRVKGVEDYVDYLILMGRPQGRCALCLNRSTHPPGVRKKYTQRSKEDNHESSNLRQGFIGEAGC